MKKSALPKILWLLSLLVFTLSGDCQTKVNKMDQLMQQFHEYDQFNGSVLVAEDGATVFKKAYGFASKELEVKNTAQTKFRLGSITKQFTAVLILQLVEEGKADLGKTIEFYLPDLTLKGKEKITLHHLLSHTSGLKRFNLEASKESYTPNELLALWDTTGLEFEPGSQFQYSNPGYFLLGVVIEKITGRSYEEVVEERIFTPLQMTNSGYDHNEQIIKNRALGYTKNRFNKYVNADYIDMSVPFAAGSLYSTVEDLYLWDRALEGEQLLTKEVKKLLFANNEPAFGGFYGYGWIMKKFPIGNSGDSILVQQHSGGVSGFGSHIVRFPEEGHLIVLLDNTQNGDMTSIIFAITGILYGKTYDLPKKSLASELVDQVLSKGVAEAEVFYKENRDSEEYHLKSNELVRPAFQLFDAMMDQEAIFLLTVNAKEFSNNSRAYVSLAEMYTMRGDYNLGLENYQKAVQINSDDINSKEMIHRIEEHLRNNSTNRETD